MAVESLKLSEQEEKPLEDTVVKIYRCSKVVKGGRRFSFAALVVVGDRAGTVGVGYGKANEVPRAVEKAVKDAKVFAQDCFAGPYDSARNQWRI